ncbi:alkaline phosphatase D family protein [Corynebacterium parakroppenstedtii]|uniref:alkaline phosphatase D family protein n=1 Tax=Corynebacterium parakroppenstedtii TaxID=2828363 RepID=UPI001C8E3760|nr:alkaline phosphatase D family protein [Corynebacterium parakroppenstedtii]MBY0796616.1 alkaline phosphatase D family protein [Corynebacterium parakroppenstedtii]
MTNKERKNTQRQVTTSSESTKPEGPYREAKRPAGRHSYTRRSFLRSSLAAGGTIAAGSALAGRYPRAYAGDVPGPDTAPQEESVDTDLFRHSVASGDPQPDSVIIWTRVTPSPEATPGSEKGADTQVNWEVSTSPDFRKIVRSGYETSSASKDHTIKVDVKDLQPDTQYFYRFAVERDGKPHYSRVGRTRTALGSGGERTVNFGVVSCSNYEAGYFRSYRDIAGRDDLEFVLHLGDYTYEYETGGYNGAYDSQVRVVQPAERTTTLQDYRIRQGCYHEDPDLADCHAAKPFICIWDDHEFADNNWREGAAGNSAGPDDNYQAIKAAAMQAYFEWLPVRVSAGNQGSHLYRKLQYGNLMEFIIPDLRTYRDYELVYTNKKMFLKTDPDFIRAAGKDDRSMMGQTQFEWFGNVLSSSPTTWQIVANEVMFAPMTLPDGLDQRTHDWLVTQIGLPDQGIPLNTDQWDGYMAERQKIIDLIADTKKNVVFLTGDIHSSWANDIPRDIQKYRSGASKDVVATEFVTPSITANGLFDTVAKSRALDQAARQVSTTAADVLQKTNAWFKWIDFIHHGYMAVSVSPDAVSCEWLHVDNVLSPNTPFRSARKCTAYKDKPGVHTNA